MPSIFLLNKHLLILQEQKISPPGPAEEAIKALIVQENSNKIKLVDCTEI